jgi:DNA-binding NarL/FixJ family response regulator
MIRILLVDDNAIVRRGIASLLAEADGLEVVGEAGDGREAIAKAEELKPDVVCLDVRMPVMDGVAATAAICATPDAPRVIVLTTFDLDETVYGALRAGASGFLLKDVRPSELVDAIRVVAGGDALLAPSVTRRLLDRFVATEAVTVRADRLAALTEREREVLALVARAASNAEIAARLVVTEATVKTHVSAILRKLGLRDRVQAVVLAYDLGLVRPNASS